MRPDEREKAIRRYVRWVQRILSRDAALKREMVVLPLERETSREAKEAAAFLIGQCHLEWSRERREMGL
jgi:hypothetical protein